MTTLADKAILSGADNRPHAIQADCDLKATNIILQGLPPEVYALVSNHRIAKELWERIQLLMQETSLTKKERECKLYDEFDKFAYKKGETLHDFYLRFSLLINDTNIYNVKLEQFQVNTKFLNTLPLEWSKFVTDVKLVRDLHTTNIDQLHAYLGQHEFHENEVRLMHERNPDPLALQGDDPIDAINHMMSFLSAVVTSRYPTTNNQLRNSLNPRQHATINDGRVTLQPVQGRQISFATGEGHMSKQCTKPKRKQDNSWFKDKVLLVQAQENGQILHEEELAFLADPGTIEVALMANLSHCDSDALAESNVVNHSETEITNDSNIIPYSQYVTKSQEFVEIGHLKQTLSEHLKENKSLMQTVTLLKNDFKKEESRNIDREIALEKKIKQLDNIVYKRDQSTQTVHMLTKPPFFYDHTTKQALGFQNPFYPKKAQQLEPKLYDGSVIKNTSAIMIPDSEETLMLAETLLLLKKRTTATAITKGSWGFEHTKACFRNEIIPSVKALKDLFNKFDQYLIDELSEVQNVFHQMEHAVEQHRLKSKTFEVKMNQVLNENKRLLEQVISKDIVNIIVNSSVDNAYENVHECEKCLKLETRLLNKKDFVEKEIYDKLFRSYTTLEKHCISLEVDTQLNQEIFQRDNSVSNQSAPSFNQYFELNELKAQSQEKDTVIKKLKERIKSLSGNYVEIFDLNESLQEKVVVITALKNELRKLMGKDLADNVVTKNTIDPEMLKIDVEPIAPRLITTIAKVPLRKPTALECDTPKPIVTLVYSRKPRKSKTNVPVSKPKIIKSVSANKKEPYKSWGSIVFNVPSSSLDECRTNNGTEFVNQTLREYYEKDGISHKIFVARSPHQNGIVERRKRTLIEAACTMLIYAKAPLFLWAEAVATTCYTQNRSIIRLRHDKTSYELLHDKLPDLPFFHVFGALYYPTNDSENLGKLQPKADIGIFIGYAPIKKAFRIYNRRTRRIIETIHVDFDELTAMASEHSSSGPAIYEMTPAIISSGLVPNPPPSTPFIPPSRTDWDLLFQSMFDELLTPLPSVDCPTPKVIALIAEVVALEPAESTGSPSSTTVDQDAPSPSNSHTTLETQSPVILNNVEEDNHDLDVAHMNNDPFFGIPILENDSEASSSLDVIPTAVHIVAPNSEHVTKWTKDHPLDYFIFEPKNYKDALTQACWIEAMQEELNEFECLEVWELVPRPDKVMVITLKWIYKVKLDELGGILKNKA
ncbi:retrovirus-related pol polyprotein from transposon TNT 1-94 [Tanacetum coccineum]